MARPKNSVNDRGWYEVEKINSYAIFMGYLLMGVRGLGLLVFTWTTVVLLGGFVSMLQKKDFWCLTAITLVQTAGVSDFLLKEKASDLDDSWKGLLSAVSAAVLKSSKIMKDKKPSIARVVVEGLLVVQVLVLDIVLCPPAVLYVLGLYVSTGVSLWRLIQHDYGKPDGGANLKPALNVLYSLAVAQGVVYGYWTIYDLVARTGLAQEVADDYSLEACLVSEYLDETVAGCMKDPSFARGRNLVTYAVDLLMESKSRYVYISGVLILGRLTLHPYGPSTLIKQLLTVTGSAASFSHVVQRLVETFGPTSPYSTEIKLQAARIVANVADSIRLGPLPQGMMIECISSLLDTFEEYNWRPEGYNNKPHDHRVHLFQPALVQRYFTLTVKQHKPASDTYFQSSQVQPNMVDLHLPREYDRDWLLDDNERFYSRYVDKIPITITTDSKKQESDSGELRLQGYKGLVVQGLRILQGLAVHEENCRLIINTQGDLLSKVMAPLVSDQLHNGDHHDQWCSMAEEALELMKRLMAAPLGETNTTKLRSLISNNAQATILRTLECHKCQVLLKRQAAHVLLHLSPDTPPPPIVLGASASSSSIIFLWILLDIFLLPDYHFHRMCGARHLAKRMCDTTRLAGEKMQAMNSSWKTEATDTTSMLPSVVGDVIGSLARTVAGTENNAYRIHAAMIMRHLVQYYTKNDENLKELKKALASMMEEVLREIVHGPAAEEIQVVTEANNGGNILQTEGLDLEQGSVPLDNDNGQESSSTPHQKKGKQHQGIQLQEALVDLCGAVYFEWIDKDQDLTRHFNEMAAKISLGQGMADKTFRDLWAKQKHNFGRRRRGLQDWHSYMPANDSSSETETSEIRGD